MYSISSFQLKDLITVFYCSTLSLRWHGHFGPICQKFTDKVMWRIEPYCIVHLSLHVREGYCRFTIWYWGDPLIYCANYCICLGLSQTSFIWQNDENFLSKCAVCTCSTVLYLSTWCLHWLSILLPIVRTVAALLLTQNYSLIMEVKLHSMGKTDKQGSLTIECTLKWNSLAQSHFTWTYKNDKKSPAMNFNIFSLILMYVYSTVAK